MLTKNVEVSRICFKTVGQKTLQQIIGPIFPDQGADPEGGKGNHSRYIDDQMLCFSLIKVF